MLPISQILQCLLVAQAFSAGSDSLSRRFVRATLEGERGQPTGQRDQQKSVAQSSGQYRIVATVTGPLGDSGFVNVTAIAVDSNGHIFIADGDGLHLADTTGRYIRHIARRGRGPAEVSLVAGLVGVRSGGAWVIDYGNARYSRFASDGRFLYSRPRSLSISILPWRGGIWNDGFVEFSRKRAKDGFQTQALITDSTWSVLAEFSLPAATEEHTPFAPKQFLVPGDGGIWVGFNDRYRVYKIGPQGDTLRQVSHSRPAYSVTPEERDEYLSAWRSRMGQMATPSGGTPKTGLPTIPTRKPFFQGVIPMYDGVGVVPIGGTADDKRLIDLFDLTGRFRGTARLPFPLGPVAPASAIGDRLLASLIHPDGTERVHILRLK